MPQGLEGSFTGTACQEVLPACWLAERFKPPPFGTVLPAGGEDGITWRSVNEGTAWSAIARRDSNQASLEKPVHKYHNMLVPGFLHSVKFIMASRIATSLQNAHSQNPPPELAAVKLHSAPKAITRAHQLPLLPDAATPAVLDLAVGGLEARATVVSGLRLAVPRVELSSRQPEPPVESRASNGIFWHRTHRRERVRDAIELPRRLREDEGNPLLIQRIRLPRHIDPKVERQASTRK